MPLEIQRRIVNDAIGNGAFTPILWLALAYFSVCGYLSFLQPLVAL